MKFNLHGLSSLLLAAACFACQPHDGQNSEQKIVDKSHLDRDLLATGPFAIEESFYKVAPSIDRDILPAPPFGQPEVKTDIRGKLYLPKGNGPFPVLVFLHGNHGTCGKVTGPGNPRLDLNVDYTLTGQCPPGMIEAPSFLGYEYSAKHLASWGYAVISINANLGITGRDGYNSRDAGLVYARGALVLKHLIKLRQWSKAGDEQALVNKDLDIKNKFDFTEVGVMGHSRGGEGVRYAYNIYETAKADSLWKRELPDLKIKGVFEIAPVDFGTGTTPLKVEALGTAWTVLIGGCDRDVSNFMGSNPYARMLGAQDGYPKAIFAIWGANHNFFNSEWQVSEAPHRCFGSQKPLWNTNADPLPGPLAMEDPYALEGVTGSVAQQTLAKALMYSFFKANVGKNVDSTLMHTFDSQYALPRALDQLAPSSREFILSNNTVRVARPGKTLKAKHTEGAITWQTFDDKLQADLPLLQKYWDAYALDNGYSRMIVTLVPESFARPALVLEGPVLNAAQTIDIPFDATTNTEHYWTVDATLARRTGCYVYPETDCVPDSSVAEVDVALIYEDGSSSDFVQLTDYIKLENYHSNYFEMAYSEPIANSGVSYRLGFSYVPLLFSTARFELTDFALQNPNIKGLRLKFPAGKPVALALDEIRLVKRANVAH
ncbi:hypothetical protein [Oligoflexus tunisiensis]|uniref:hypothetical protein n=1 Tax=Oligoflexus tunisiensis TaxID=708132 RepID=UPI00114C8A1F|nr:hypothetical protein [Oligoflexus tunisiensis]